MNSALLLDCIIIGVTLILGLGGIISGLIKEGFGLAGILIGVYVSTSYADDAAGLINQYIYKSDNEMLLKLFGFVITLVIIWGIFIILGRIISKLAALSGLGLIDKIMGFIFGAGKIFIIFSIIASCINAVPILNNKIGQYFANSLVFPVLVQTGSAIANIQIVQNTLNTKAQTSEDLKNNNM